jgi:hypothetical protein
VASCLLLGKDKDDGYMMNGLGEIILKAILKIIGIGFITFLS